MPRTAASLERTDVRAARANPPGGRGPLRCATVRSVRGLVSIALFCLLGACTIPRSRPSSTAVRGTLPADCREAAVALQVLGSGGPIADDARASSGYLVWVRGRPRVLVDAGPGVMLRLGETGADVTDLDAVLLTHLHVDHSADMAGLLKSMSFGARRSPLPVVGPTRGAGFPGVEAFLAALLSDGGAYPYLGYTQTRRPFEVVPREVDTTTPAAVEVRVTDGVGVRAIGVPHGRVPALAFVVSVEGRTIAFMGDQRADERRYVETIRGADVLVAHMAIAPDTGGVAARLHAPPARLGEVAAEAGVGAMVLSHLMRRSLLNLDANVASIAARYDGPVIVAEDGMCFRVPFAGGR